MNFWTGLILGIIIGWLVEWVIDWLFWRRDAEDARDLEEEGMAAESYAADSDAEWEGRLAAAEQDYQARLQAVEEEWQARLNLNEQQWQTQFAALDEDNRAMQVQMADMVAAATIAGAGAQLLDEDSGVEPGAEATVSAGFDQLDGMDPDLAERMHLAGIDSIDTLAEADPTALSIAMGVDRDETQQWIDRAASIVGPPAAIVAAEDDLTLIHGIGPKYAAVLAGAGIASFDDLAASSPDQLREIIRPSAMQQLNFDSWIAQAVALAGTRGTQLGDDLTQLEGIGPVYASKLNEQGITTFAELAAAEETTLAGIIAAPAWRRVNYGDWIEQARLAAAGDDKGLDALQDRLFRRPADNLTLVHGLGPRSAEALNAAGITSFAGLAGASPQELDGILRDAGIRGGFDFDGWISEAGLRAAGRRVPTGRARATHTVSCPQDLSAVSGIGAVFEERLYAAGIGSYWELAEMDAGELSNTLEAEAFQDVDLGAIKAAAMRLAAESNTLGRVWDGTPPDDFEVLSGIGEVYERRLYEAGICTYDTLAATSAERLAEVCRAPAMRTPDYAAWIATASELSAARRSG